MLTNLVGLQNNVKSSADLHNKNQ